MTPDQMAKTSWDELMMARHALPPDDPQQAQVAPFEHRAWARERVAENPLLAPAYAAMVPGYQLVKLVRSFGGDRGARTAPSMDQLAGGMTGIAEGVQQWLRDRRVATSAR